MENHVSVSEEQERAGAVIDIDAELVENIAALIEAKQQGMLLNLVADMYPADLAQLLTHLPFADAREVFRWLPAEQAGELLAELDDSYRAALLEEAPHRRLTELIDQLDTDDAADVLADLPDEVASQVLLTLEDVDDLRELLTYPEETAGGIMATEYVAVLPTWTVAEATEEVRRNAEEVEQVYALFVVDEAEQLLGVVTLKRLLLSPAHTLVGNIMNTDVISVTTDLDQEEVARIMQRYDLVSLPVIDEKGSMVGRVTIDDAVDIIREEAEEDIQRMSGVAGGEEPTDSVFRVSRGRLPWLLIGMVGAGCSGLVIGVFEKSLMEQVVLASFIPVVMAMAGNAGIQSSAIVVQGLASGELWASDLIRQLGKELGVAMINGIVLAVVLGLGVVGLFHLRPDPDVSADRLAFTAALSMLTVIILATIIGATVPLLLNRFGIDPAIATGPFITTSNDILALAVFFLLASMIYLSV